MIKLRNLISERYVNLISVEDRTKFIDTVWDMLQSSYVKIGGFKSAKDKQDLISKTFFWKLVKLNGKIVAGSLYKNKFGRKSIASFSDGTPEGKQSLYNIWIEDIKLSRSWSEASGATEHIKLKLGEKMVPNKYVADILDKEIISYNPDGYHYTRLIQGEPKEKVLVGNIDGYPLN